MSAKGIRGNIDLRRGLGSKTTDREKIMEDGPAGDWLALRSDQLLKWIDDASAARYITAKCTELFAVASDQQVLSQKLDILAKHQIDLHEEKWGDKPEF